jgi:hypothetical protein
MDTAVELERRRIIGDIEQYCSHDDESDEDPDRPTIYTGASAYGIPWQSNQEPTQGRELQATPITSSRLKRQQNFQVHRQRESPVEET